MSKSEIAHLTSSIRHALGKPEQTLFLCSGLGPAAAGLIKEIVERGSRIIYLENAAAALKQSPHRFHQDGVQIVLSPKQQIPFREASFDLVVSYWSLHHSPDPHLLLAEICRVLKSEGRLLIIEGIDQPGDTAQELHRKIHKFSISIDKAKGRCHEALLTPAEIIEMATKCGYTEITAQKVIETGSALSEDDRDSLKKEIIRMLTRVYPAELIKIPGDAARFGQQLASLSRDLENTEFKLHPYFELMASKPEKSASVYHSRKRRGEAADQRPNYQNQVSGKSTDYSLNVADLPDDQKPREKLILHGPGALKNHELLAILLVTGTLKENVLELSHRLISEYGSRALSQERSVRRMQETLGIGTNKACQILAAFELGRRFFEEPNHSAPVIQGAEDAYQYLREMAKLTKEHFRGLYLNTRGRVIRDEIISIGTLNMSVVHPREVFLPAIEFSAAAIILAHNHPSGDPTPSEEDIAITEQLVEASHVMGIEIFDHIIVGESGFVSFRKEGRLR
ncbi:MAG: DNA repair protein RadC [bacterium]|nr:DNA repair protein RadC [bacterium]